MILSKRVGHARIAILTQQLSVLVECGIPLLESLRHLVQEETHPLLRMTLIRVIQDVEAGASLAAALTKHPAVFSEVAVGMVRAGEAGGRLDVVLKRLAAASARTARTHQTVATMLVYPVALACVSCLLVGAILVWVVPTFRDLLATLDAPLPLPTRLVLEAGQWVFRFLPALLLSALLSAVALSQLVSLTSLKGSVDDLLLRVPLLGRTLASAILGRLALTLGTLLESGLPVLEALETTGRAAGNRSVRKAVQNVKEAVASGQSLSAALRRCRFFPGTFTRLVAAGEHSGELARTLLTVGSYYEDRSIAATSNLVAVLEPLILVGLGVTVGGIVVSMYLPIFDLISRLSTFH